MGDYERYLVFVRKHTMDGSHWVKVADDEFRGTDDALRDRVQGVYLLVNVAYGTAMEFKVETKFTQVG